MGGIEFIGKERRAPRRRRCKLAGKTLQLYAHSKRSIARGLPAGKPPICATKGTNPTDCATDLRQIVFSPRLPNLKPFRCRFRPATRHYRASRLESAHRSGSIERSLSSVTRNSASCGVPGVRSIIRKEQPQILRLRLPQNAANFAQDDSYSYGLSFRDRTLDNEILRHDILEKIQESSPARRRSSPRPADTPTRHRMIADFALWSTAERSSHRLRSMHHLLDDLPWIFDRDRGSCALFRSAGPQAHRCGRRCRHRVWPLRLSSLPGGAAGLSPLRFPSTPLRRSSWTPASRARLIPPSSSASPFSATLSSPDSFRADLAASSNAVAMASSAPASS